MSNHDKHPVHHTLKCASHTSLTISGLLHQPSEGENCVTLFFCLHRQPPISAGPVSIAPILLPERGLGLPVRYPGCASSVARAVGALTQARWLMLSGSLAQARRAPRAFSPRQRESVSVPVRFRQHAHTQRAHAQLPCRRSWCCSPSACVSLLSPAVRPWLSLSRRFFRLIFGWFRGKHSGNTRRK